MAKLQTAAVPEQMRVMKSLGFEAQDTDSHKFACWSGHGVELRLPSDLNLTLHEAVLAVIGAGAKMGREVAQAEMRRVLGLG